MGARADARRLRADRRRQRLDRRLGRARRRARRARRARAAARLRRRLLRRPDARREAELVCFMDCDGSLDPRELPRVADPVAAGHGRPRARRPAPGAGRRLAAARAAPRTPCSRSSCAAAPACGVTDLGPMRAARREPLLALGIRDRRFGWPLEMVLRAAAAGLADRGGPGDLPRPRGPLEGHRHGARHRARGARHGRRARVNRMRAWRAYTHGPRTAGDRQGAGAGRVKTRLTPPCTPEQAARARPRGARGHARRRAAPSSATAGACSCSTASPGDWLPDGFEVIAAARRRPRRAARGGVRGRRRPGVPRRHGHAAGHARAARRRASTRSPRGDAAFGAGARRRLLGHRPARARRRACSTACR